MCLCGDWDPKQVDRQIANRKYKAQMPNGGPRYPGPWGMEDPYMKDPYIISRSGGMTSGAPPRIGLPPGMATGLGSRRTPPRSVPRPGPDFNAPPRPRSNAGGGSQRGGDIGSGSRRGESRHADGSRRGSGRQSSMYGASARPGPDPVGPRTFNRRGGPPPAGGGAWMHGGLGGSMADAGRARSRSRGASSGRGDPPPEVRTHASGMSTIRGPMPPGMKMGGRTGSRRSSSRTGL